MKHENTKTRKHEREIRFVSWFRAFVVSCLQLAALAGLTAQSAPSFKFDRPIVSGGAGPRRLTIDVPLLVGSAPFRVAARTVDRHTGEPVILLADGLRDLRFYDSNGAEIGYLFVGPTRPEPEYFASMILAVAPTEDAQQRTSGFEADLGLPAVVDRFRVEGLPPPFVKRVRLEGSGDREHWTLLVGEGTLFDLPDDRMRQIELRFRPGPYRYLRLTWDDTRSGQLPRPDAALAGRLGAGVPPPPPLTTPLAFDRRPSEPGRSRFRIRLPGGHLPIARLNLDVGGGHLLRRAQLFEARLSGPQLTPVRLGEATLSRVVRGDLTAAQLHIDIEPPAEAQLDLDVDDGDNPPLELRGMTAEFAPLPWIYLEAPAGAIAARYGNATLSAPRYDLQAVRDQIRIENVADAGWGEPRPRSADENAGAAPPLPTVGASLDTSLFRYVRGVAPGNAGLLAVALDAPALAHSAGPDGGFSDLRVVDSADRQIPYIVEQAAEPLAIDVGVEKIAPPKSLGAVRGNRSVYRVPYPVAGLPASRLVLSTPSRVFDRHVTVAQERQPDQIHRDPWVERIADVSWTHADNERPATPIAIGIPRRVVPPVRAGESAPPEPPLLLIVDEGDNTPLPIDKPHVLLPAYRVRLYREPNARLRVAYGRTDLSRPQYDLALLAPQLLGAVAIDAALEAERSTEAATSTAAFVSPRLFWGALTIAVVVLLALIGRLLRREQG